MSRVNPDNLDKIEEVQNLSYRRQLTWAGEAWNPWRDMRMRETVVERSDVNVIDGNVTRMPPLGGRPCFGNPLAWAVHGRHPTDIGRNGLVRSRCGRCKARQGCERVAEDRLSSTPAIRDAEADFRRSGGRIALRSNNAHAARKARADLINALDAHGPFTSTNDQFAREWPDNERKRVKEAATARQRKKRAADAKRGLKDGVIPDELADALVSERKFRFVRFRQFQNSGTAPLTVTNDPKGDLAAFTSDVWLMREQAKIQRRSITAYSVAKSMVEAGNAHGLTFNSLRDRVGQAFSRIAVLEQRSLPGTSEKIWPAFEARRALADALERPPYETA